MSPFTIPALLVNTASGIVGMELGAMGPNYAVRGRSEPWNASGQGTGDCEALERGDICFPAACTEVASACAAGSHAIGDAMRMLRSGMADVRGR